MHSTRVPTEPLLQVEGLTLDYPAGAAATAAPARVLEQVSFALSAGECLGLVGESGSGKSQLLLAMLGLLPRNAQLRGSVRFDGQELLHRPAAILNRLRGTRIALIFQDPSGALNPYQRIGDQIAESARVHAGLSRGAAWQRALQLLRDVQLSEPERRARAYPHELSGGQRQRVLLAMALIGEPELLLLDEPTTALDVTVQAQILELLQELRSRTRVALLFVSHDLLAVAQLADRIAVLKSGRLIEQAATATLFAQPREPYTRALLQAMPRLDEPLPETGTAAQAARPPLLEVRDLAVSYRIEHAGRSHALHALRGISFDVHQGETLGVVGESGSGKSTLARALLRLLRADAGSVRFRERDLLQLSPGELRAERRHLQLIFQDPVGALDPRMRIGDTLTEPLQIYRPELGAHAHQSMAAQALQRVGLDAAHLARYPHEFSGGQAQRIAIARALILEPQLIICDEPLSALDMQIRGQIADLLQQLRQQLRLSLLFIAHDLPAVRRLCERVLVLYLGRVMEIAPRTTLFDAPRHPYTRALLQSARGAAAAPGELPSALSPPSGCVFRTRCALAVERCAREIPALQALGDGWVACHRAAETRP